MPSDFRRTLRIMPKEPFPMTSNGSYASKKDEDMERQKVMKVLVDQQLKQMSPYWLIYHVTAFTRFNYAHCGLSRLKFTVFTSFSYGNYIEKLQIWGCP